MKLVRTKILTQGRDENGLVIRIPALGHQEFTVNTDASRRDVQEDTTYYVYLNQDAKNKNDLQIDWNTIEEAPEHEMVFDDWDSGNY